ncbi:hypothetical protein XENOCAPTIV_009492 [Xenoophorus captivus]|uniref:adenylate cyclase n=1 Tax=Xenoophorus captivus TaxID=1517983 RepID=A0ABV0QQV1_9TELE
MQVFSKALLYLAMNTAGIFINYLSDRTQRQSFLETRRCIEGRVRLERENQRQVKSLKEICTDVKQKSTSLLSFSQERLVMSILPRFLVMEMIADMAAVDEYLLPQQFHKIYIHHYKDEHQCLRIKILGDCYYCVSGVPEPQRGHARCCVEMGLSMISTIRSSRVSNTHLALTRTAKTTIEPDLFMFPLGGKEMSSSLRQVHISQATLDCLGGIYETEQGHGQERNEFLRKHNINTYLIRPATWEEAQPPKARRPSYDELTTWSAELPFGDILGMNFIRDELFKSNMVCSFILLILLMAVQVLIPAPR